MNTIKALFFLVIFTFSLVAVPAQAASDDNRYFVKSNSQFWMKSFNARHQFEGGFSADLTDFQLRLAKVFGVEVEPIKKLTILAVPTPLATKRAGKPALSKTPTDQTPWGVEMMYDDPLLTKSSGGADVLVAVLDTGVDKNHPDLKNRIAQCKDFSGPTEAITDGRCEDKNGHGTHVAGIVAADGGAGKGIYGIAPQARLFAYKVCGNNGTCFADDVAAGLRVAADSGANVINLSLGSDSSSPLIESAVVYAINKGVLVVAAAGNDGPYVNSIDYPAAYAGVVSVGAIDAAINVPDWSARGKNEDTQSYVKEDGDIEFAAPGLNVESTGIGEYAVLSGTSMAAPHVAGFAAKEWQKSAESPAEATRELLRQFARDILPTGDDNASGWGIPTL